MGQKRSQSQRHSVNKSDVEDSEPNSKSNRHRGKTANDLNGGRELLQTKLLEF